MDETEFDRFADEYRQLHASNIRVSGESPEFFAEYKVRDVTELLAATRAGSTRSILDFGAGIGTSVAHFRRWIPDARLTCLDVSRKSLEVGRRRFPDQADFVHFDGVRVPFPDGKFDVVFAACVFHHIPAPEHPPILRELRRVLRDGGRIVVFEHNPFNPLTVRAVDSCVFDENAVLIRPGALRSAIGEAGFGEVGVKFRIFFPRAFRGLRPLERWMTGIPLGAQYFVHGRKV